MLYMVHCKAVSHAIYTSWKMSAIKWNPLHARPQENSYNTTMSQRPFISYFLRKSTGDAIDLTEPIPPTTIYNVVKKQLSNLCFWKLYGLYTWYEKL